MIIERLSSWSVRCNFRPIVRPSVRLSVCPFVRLSVCPSVRLSVSPIVGPEKTGAKNGVAFELLLHATNNVHTISILHQR